MHVEWAWPIKLPNSISIVARGFRSHSAPTKIVVEHTVPVSGGVVRALLALHTIVVPSKRKHKASFKMLT